MADALARLLEQPTLCQRLGAKGYIKVKGQYSMDVVGRRLSDVTMKIATRFQEDKAA